MWLLIGNKTRAKRIPDGREVERMCSTCRDVTRFVECDVKDEINAFFVKVFEATQRRMVCLECGDDLAMDASPPIRVMAPTRAAPTRKPISDADTDAMLAELKRKMREGG